MDFFLFLLVNVTLFIRPGELIPALVGWPIYNYIIVLNLLVAAPVLINQLNEKSLSQNPVTVCVLGVLVFIPLSQLARFDLGRAWEYGYDFVKVLAYFLLLMGTVNTPRRLFILLGAVAACTLVVAVLAVMQHHGQIDLPSLRSDVQGGRMHATGIFGDPNDFSMIIVASILICCGGLLCPQLGFFRALLVGPIGFLGYALTLTQSRGGLLALLAGCGVVFYARFGMVRAGILAAAVLPVMLAGFGGRQIDFAGALESGTGRSRIGLWADGLEAFKASPVLGIGCGRYGETTNGQVAHNSFLHAFVELGFVGGAMFLGAFGIAGWSLWKLRAVRGEIADPALRHFLPYMIGIVAAYAVSMMALSRSYDVPTYLFAGCAAVFVRVAQPGTSLVPERLNSKLLTRLGMVSFGFLLSVHLYIKFFQR